MMATLPRVTFGKGGFDPQRPASNVVDAGTETVTDLPADLPPALAMIRNAATGQGQQPTTDQLVLALARAFWRVLVQNNSPNP